MGEASEFLSLPGEQVAGAGIATVPDMQHDLLRQRHHTVLGRRGVCEPKHRLRLGRADLAAHGDAHRAAAAIAAGAGARFVVSGRLVQGWTPSVPPGWGLNAGRARAAVPAREAVPARRAARTREGGRGCRYAA